MRSTLTLSGIPPQQINIRKKQFILRTYVDAFDWLHELKISPEYKEFLAVRRLLSDETWATYKLLGLTGLVETDLLAATCSALKKRWKNNRPPIFNKNREKDNEN